MTTRFRMEEGVPYLTETPADGVEAGVNGGLAWVSLTLGDTVAHAVASDPDALAGRLEALAAWLRDHAGDELTDGMEIGTPAGAGTDKTDGPAVPPKTEDPKADDDADEGDWGAGDDGDW